MQNNNNKWVNQQSQSLKRTYFCCSTHTPFQSLETLKCYISIHHLTSTKQNILSSRVPDDQTNSSLMGHQIDHAFLEIGRQTAFRDLPYFDRAIFRSTGNQGVVMRTPLQIKDCCFVPNNQRGFPVHSTNLDIGEKTRIKTYQNLDYSSF